MLWPPVPTQRKVRAPAPCAKVSKSREVLVCWREMAAGQSQANNVLGPGGGGGGDGGQDDGQRIIGMRAMHELWGSQTVDS